MKITKKHNDGATSFAEIKEGMVFLARNTYYIKTFPVNAIGGDVNAVNLENGNFAYFGNKDRVKLCNTEMIVEV